MAEMIKVATCREYEMHVRKVCTISMGKSYSTLLPKTSTRACYDDQDLF